MTPTLVESVTLPSKGLIYDKKINPEIRLRSMTTNEEMLRLNPVGERQYKTMADILDACMVEGPGVSSYDLCVGDF